MEEIKDRLSIEDVVGRYVELKRSGASYKGLCPFHQEKTPSFYVSPARGTYHCFGCGRGGDVFSFVMEHDKLRFPDAVQVLARQAGVQVPERESRTPSLKGRLYEANAAAAAFFKDALLAEKGAAARRYLGNRQIDHRAIDLFELGYGPDGRDALVQHLRPLGFDDKLLLQAGLAVQDDIGGKARDRFRGRLMFPIRDASGRVAGFGGRTISESPSGPKYLNSPQTETFDKSSVLFGIHLAQDAVRSAGRAVLVEGYLDAVRAHMAGFADTVASLGTAVTPQQLRSLSRLASTIIFALDPDPAGQAAAARAGLRALADVIKGRAGGSAGGQANLDLRIARLPEDMGDPDELIRDHPNRWEEILAGAVPAFDFYFEQTLQSIDRGDESWRQEAIDRLLPVIQEFAGRVGWQAVWLERLARETGLDPRALHRSLPAAQRTRSRRVPSSLVERGKDVAGQTTARALARDPRQGEEESLVAELLQILVLPQEVAERVQAVPLEMPEHRAVVEALLAWRVNRNYDYELFRETLPPDARDVADRLHERAEPLPEEAQLGVAVTTYIERLRDFELRAQLQRATHILQDMTSDEARPFLDNYAELTARKHQLEQAQDKLSEEVLRSRRVRGTGPDEDPV